MYLGNEIKKRKRDQDERNWRTREKSFTTTNTRETTESETRFGIRLRFYSIIVQNAIFKNAYKTPIYAYIKHVDVRRQTRFA